MEAGISKYIWFSKLAIFEEHLGKTDINKCQSEVVDIKAFGVTRDIDSTQEFPWKPSMAELQAKRRSKLYQYIITVAGATHSHKFSPSN